MIAALLLVGCAAIVFVAASRDGDRSPTAPHGASPPDVSDVAPALDSARPIASVARPREDAHDPGPLAGFHAALAELETGARRDPVRVLFFGDSHAQGEYWTGGLRERLQRRFGDAGPGFVDAGSPRHRNDALRVTTRGAFTIEPRDPASTTRYEDGALGLGGLLVRPRAGVARVELSPRADGGAPMRWDVCARSGAPPGTVQATGDGLAAREITATPRPSHVVLETAPPNHLTLDVDGARLCGVVGERKDTPGVVLDALGINGARFATPLAWDEASFAQEVARRAPDLVILEYGTNEASDLPPRLAEVARDLETLVDRVRRAAPRASCLVLGLTERDDRIDTTPLLRDAFGAAAERAGCAFWDTYAAMGGRGSMRRWQEASPTLAQRDGIHLTEGGYAKLAALLYDDLVRELPEAPR